MYLQGEHAFMAVSTLDNLPPDWNDWSLNSSSSLSPVSNEPVTAFQSRISSKEFVVLNSKKFGIGFQLWPAAVVMCRWMEDKMEQVYGKDWMKDKTVLELGAGCGLVGMVSLGFGAKQVVVTDLKEVVPHLEENLRINHMDKNNIKAAALEWGKSEEWDDEYY